MKNCPSCDNPIDEHFGLVNCAQCGSLLAVDLDGNVSLSNSFEPVGSSATNERSADTDGDGETFLSSSVAQLGEPSPSPESHDASESTKLGLSEIAEYGNSEISEARNGAYLFDICVRGIDSKELRETVQECLTDSKFVWDVALLIKGVRLGVLKIEKVNPVKASVLINRLKAHPLDVSWELREVTQPGN